MRLGLVALACVVGSVASLYVGGFYAYADTSSGWSDPGAQRMIVLSIGLGVVAVGCVIAAIVIYRRDRRSRSSRG